jgi:hypothetical protein
MTDNAFEPTKIISALEILLAQLEASLAPYITEDAAADRLKSRLMASRKRPPD